MKQGRFAVERPFPDSPVPEAMGRLLALLEGQVEARAMDRIWIFPPLIRGRKEWGLIAVSCLTDDPAQRSLVTGRYNAEMTGKGVLFEPEFVSEGSAPPDRLPLVMDGVVRRSDLQLGVAREAEIGGDADKYRDLLVEYGSGDRPADPETQ
jgi:hypothetical protein